MGFKTSGNLGHLIKRPSSRQSVNDYNISDGNMYIKMYKCSKIFYKALEHINTDSYMAHVHYASTLHKSLINSFLGWQVLRMFN